jgi:ABC-2 type transport system permease protein
MGVVFTLLMSAMGGCWWPAEVMPRWLRTAALAFPTSWAMGGLHEVISWGGGLADVAPNIIVLLGFALAAPAGSGSWKPDAADRGDQA